MCSTRIALGVSRTQIAYLESGNRGISLELLVEVANTLEVPITELLADSLTSQDGITNTDLYYILLDCNKQEEKIITKTAQALKAALLEQGV